MARRTLGPAGLLVLRAVREAIDDRIPADATLMVACSGGADSLALAAATRKVAALTHRPVAAIVVDHRLQPGSAEQAERALDQLAALGYDDRVVRVAEPGPARLGPEGAARVSRYAVLDDEARQRKAILLLGHTLDDQAETVLLGLLRGSGARSLAGMGVWDSPRWSPGERDSYPYRGQLRPLLGLRRATTAEACREAGLEPWTDPQNSDPSFTRVRIRERVLPLMEQELGGGVAEALARTAELIRDDASVLDQLAGRLAAETGGPDWAVEGPECAALARAPRAVRNRVIRSWLLDSGATRLYAHHIWAVEALVNDWHGQRWIDVPGLRVRRVGGRLVSEPPG